MKGENGELKEETIEGVDNDWGGMDDQIGEMVNDEATAKAAA